MKSDHLLLRALHGMPIAVLINTGIVLAISIGMGDGIYYAATPEACDYYGSELTAVIVQFVSMLAYGAVWGVASTFWNHPKWSLLRQTVLHFLVAASATFVVMWINFWVPHVAISVTSFLIVFAAIYAAIWAGIYFQTKKRIREINERIEGGEMK